MSKACNWARNTHLLFIAYCLCYIKIERKKTMKLPAKKVSVTFSIPIELNNMLHSMVDRRKLSLFVAQALEHALKEKKQTLKEEYIQASKDPHRLKTIEDWEVLDGEDWND